MTVLKKAIVVTDLGFGDCGKGTITDYLCRREGADLVVKLSGGAQCAHNVVTPEGKHHTFSSFGAGTFAGARTHLSRFFLVNPVKILDEALDLAHSLYDRDGLGNSVGNPLKDLSIDPDALLTTPVHVAANRLRENARNGELHGSTGMGIGETQADGLRIKRPMTVRDMSWHPMMIYKMLQQDRTAKIHQLKDEGIPLEGEALEFFEDDVLRDYANACEELTQYVKTCSVPEWSETTIFEGSQGVLLDQDYGTFPHVTYAKTTGANFNKMMDDIGHTKAVDVHHVGVMRTYQTRHGAGPFPTEDPELRDILPEEHNSDEANAGAWRTGHLDLVLTRYAIRACERDDLPIDCIALTHVDRTFNLWASRGEWKAATSYAVPLAYGELEGERTDMPLRPDGFGLEMQAHWTAALGNINPIYKTISNSLDISEELGCLPVRILSWGMTHQEKTGTV